MLESYIDRNSVYGRRSVSHVRQMPRNSRSVLVSDKRLTDILTMFLDLGLTPREMSKTSGFPLAMVVAGLKQLDDIPRLPAFSHCAKN